MILITTKAPAFAEALALRFAREYAASAEVAVVILHSLNAAFNPLREIAVRAALDSARGRCSEAGNGGESTTTAGLPIVSGVPSVPSPPRRPGIPGDYVDPSSVRVLRCARGGDLNSPLAYWLGTIVLASPRQSTLAPERGPGGGWGSGSGTIPQSILPHSPQAARKISAGKALRMLEHKL